MKRDIKEMTSEEWAEELREAKEISAGLGVMAHSLYLEMRDIAVKASMYKDSGRKFPYSEIVRYLEIEEKLIPRIEKYILVFGGREEIATKNEFRARKKEDKPYEQWELDLWGEEDDI